jgi:hypothetical protein
MTYLVLVFQSGFDGLVLKYNPNVQDSGVQVAMFYVSKCIESVVVSSALIHASLVTPYYVLYMFNFTVAVACSMISAYDLVAPSTVVMVFEHWALQAMLGASGGILMCLAVYFSHLERSRSEYVRTSSLAMIAVFATVFAASALTGMFG